jgi:hypothetical protein
MAEDNLPRRHIRWYTCDAKQEAIMGEPRWLQEQFEGVRKWLHEVAFGRLQATQEEVGSKVRWFGTIKRLLGQS